MNLQNETTWAPKVTWAGEQSEHFLSFQSPEMFFLLTLPFIERAYRTGPHLSGNPINQELGELRGPG
jgi:hypothetical protein